MTTFLRRLLAEWRAWLTQPAAVCVPARITYFGASEPHTDATKRGAKR